MIRTAVPADIPTIVKIAMTTWPVAYKEILSIEQLKYMLDKFYEENVLKQQMKNGQHFILSINNRGIFTGYASYGKQRDQDDSFHLDKLYVLPEYQKNHFGIELLKYVMDDALKRGITHLNLNVNRYNKAKLFYERMGFTVKCPVDIPIGDGFFMNDFIMEKSLLK